VGITIPPPQLGSPFLALSDVRPFPPFRCAPPPPSLAPEAWDGCPNATASECTVLLTAAGQTKAIPLGDTSAAGFVVRYAPGAAAAFEADAAGDTEVLLVVPADPRRRLSGRWGLLAVLEIMATQAVGGMRLPRCAAATPKRAVGWY